MCLQSAFRRTGNNKNWFDCFHFLLFFLFLLWFLQCSTSVSWLAFPWSDRCKQRGTININQPRLAVRSTRRNGLICTRTAGNAASSPMLNPVPLHTQPGGQQDSAEYSAKKRSCWGCCCYDHRGWTCEERSFSFCMAQPTSEEPVIPAIARTYLYLNTICLCLVRFEHCICQLCWSTKLLHTHLPSPIRFYHRLHLHCWMTIVRTTAAAAINLLPCICISVLFVCSSLSPSPHHGQLQFNFEC